MGANVLTDPAYHIELIDGREIQKPLPKHPHAIVQWFIIRWFLTRLPAVDALPELNVICGEDRLVPDITVPSSNVHFVDGDLVSPPDLAVEIFSPGQVLNDLISKCYRLLKTGTGMCWVIWPEKRRAWNFSLNDIEEVGGHNSTNRSLRFGVLDSQGVFQPVEYLPVDDLWAELDRRGL